MFLAGAGLDTGKSKGSVPHHKGVGCGEIQICRVVLLNVGVGWDGNPYGYGSVVTDPLQTGCQDACNVLRNAYLKDTSDICNK